MSSIIVAGDTSGSVTLQAQAVSGSTTLTLPTTSGTLLTTTSGQWITSGSDIYYNTGNVGIGTTSPSAILHTVASGIAGVATGAYFTATGNGGAGRGTGILIGAPGSASVVNVARIDGLQETAASTANNASLVFNVANTSGTLTERMRIDSSGNVGIGTTSPNARLDINGNVASAIQTTFTRGTSDSNFQLQAINGVTGTSSGTVMSTFGLVYSGTGEAATIKFNRGGGATDGSLAFNTNGTERMRIDSTGYVTNTVNGGGAGLHQAQLYYRLNSAVAGANVSTAQSIFGVGVTLVASTQYEFEMVVAMIKTAGTTSHTYSIGFGGTATINNIGYDWTQQQSATNFNPGSASMVSGFAQSTAATQINSGLTTAGSYIWYLVKGTVSVNAAGTFIPQYTLSAAPGGAYTTQIGSYIKISPLAASGANVNIGSWA